MRIVVKIGGSIIDEDLSYLAEDIRSLFDEGHELLIVHGGAKIVTRLTEKMGQIP